MANDFRNYRNEAFQNKDSFKEYFDYFAHIYFGKDLSETGMIEKYVVLAKMVRTYMLEDWRETKYIVRTDNKKQIYYFSLEFLLGRMLRNNLMSLGIYDVVKDGLKDLNVSLDDLEEIETDAGLGNGGLGRLAACFLDSMATLNYPGSGNTIRYQSGLFKQFIINNEQVEVPDQWLRIENPWEIRKADKTVDVRFYGYVDVVRDSNGELEFHRKDTEHVLAVPYDMPIVGYNTETSNTLRMWSAEPSDDLPKGRDYREYLSDVDDICLNLYPDDTTEKGKYLRIKQEYFFVAAGLQSIINDHMKVYGTLDNFAEKVVIQLNDTHPALAVPELMRILMDAYHIPWAKAWNIVTHTFAYTNHTVMQEALEKWPVEFIKKLLPRIYMIIEEIDNQFKRELIAMGKKHNFIDSVCIIHEGNIRMAYLSIVGSFSVNGVAKIHSNIIKNDTFRDFYEIYPEKFNNKTNGITPRRWLMYANPELCQLIEKYIGPDFRYDFNRIEDLINHVDNEELQQEFLKVKQIKKEQLSRWVKKNYDLDIDPNSIYDSIAKRLHAYKRQLMDIMYVISLYYRIKEDPEFTMPKTTFLFGAKAASAYTFAKKIIKLINCVAEKVNADPDVNRFINVVFIPNYRVTVSEKLMPASDISEQISTAGKEASGTGNMKFMMNGAVTLGTLDGANVEIRELVGDDNCVIFGFHEDEIRHLKKYGYDAYTYYEKNPVLKQIIDSFTDGTWSDDPGDFKDIADEFLLRNDEYMVLADFDDYVEAHQKVYQYYADPKRWARMCLVNIAKSAYFSSDRTIEEYAGDIWKISKIRS
ncbi:MAG: glycogen/starch/alpha-glucan phosphorylase [Erysipelotrichaceae bacterium]|nr:glycogen/starch/alpha-glucan phosphorylase [Erysipelotrichaceae bacterium]MBQ1534608.1 glycogen/starch/alpha-glucan phosphorylase [Erysipelotrichaceae bacterium]